MTPAEYEVELRVIVPVYEQQSSGVYGWSFNLELIGDIRELAQNLKWTKARTSTGVDSISFTVNDVLFEEWLGMRKSSISEVIKPQFLDCRIVRNGVDIVGGYLATVPSYSALNTSANLTLQFDGYLNFLDGIYISPTAATTATFDSMITDWVDTANTRNYNYTDVVGGFGFTKGDIETLSTVTKTINGYKTVKSLIVDASDNSEGAGSFEFYIHPDRVYDIIADANFGTTQTYKIYYPEIATAISAASISADEVDGYVTRMICVGAGELSSDSVTNTAITSTADTTRDDNLFAYAEGLLQLSSIATQSVLDSHASAEVYERSDLSWLPKITLSGRQVNPAPSGEPYIWIGDTVTVQNDNDATGRMNGSFKVKQIDVSVSATGAETIAPTLERVTS